MSKKQVNEEMSITSTCNSGGEKSVSVYATGCEADQLAQILLSAGLCSAPQEAEPKVVAVSQEQAVQSANVSSNAQIIAKALSVVGESYANEPDEKTVDADTQLNTMSGGLNRRKKQVNPNNPGDNPLAMKKLGKMPGAQINIEESLRLQYEAFKTKPVVESHRRNSFNLSSVAEEEDATEDVLVKPARVGKPAPAITPESTFSDYEAAVSEDVETEGNIGDQVKIVGNVSFEGEVGVIANFGQDRRFVVVDLYQHGKHSFHSSNVELCDEGCDDEDF